MSNGISERELVSFIRNYISSLEELIQSKYPEVKSINIISEFPLEFPVKVVAYLLERGILVDYFKSNHFEFVLKKEEPQEERTQSRQFILYSHFLHWKDRAYEKAELDIKRFINLPKEFEENEQAMDRYYEALWYEEMENVIDNYIEYVDSARLVVERTKKEKISEVHSIIELIRNHLRRFEFILKSGCCTLSQLYFMINSDMEVSFFLALNGKYFIADSILRKILEVNIRAIYLDITYQQNENLVKTIRDEWLNGGKPRITFKDTVNKLIDGELDLKISKIMKELEIPEGVSFKTHITETYEKLCGYVHLRPKVDWEQDILVSFSQFDKSKFDEYYALFNDVTRICDILLLVKFPSILSAKALGGSQAKFSDFLKYSKEQLDVLVKITL